MERAHELDVEDRGRLSEPRSIGAGEIYRAEAPRLTAVAFRVLGDRGAAEDIVHETFTEFLRVDPDSIENPGAWLRTVAWRRAVTLARRRHRTTALDPSAERGAEPFYDDVDPSLIAALRALPPNQRAAVLFVWGDGVDTASAARMIGCSAATVRVHLFRARKTLRTKLAHLEDDL